MSEYAKHGEEPRSERSAPPRGTVAYLSSMFPLRSETFVYREVRELRRRGWNVVPVSLHQPPESNLSECADLGAADIAYAPGMLASAMRELIAHPLRASATLGLAVKDAVLPGEKLSVGARLKLIGQAIAALALARSLRRAGTQHLHCHFAHAPASVGMYAAHQLNVGFSFTGHANDLFQRRALLRRKLDRAAFVSCISQWHRELYRSVSARDDQTYRVIRCGVDTGNWRPSSAGSHESPALRVLTICRLVEKKGVDTLIHAMHELGMSHRIEWKLTIAGDGPESSRLQRLAEELKCGGSIEWLGEVANEQIPALLAQADVFALPCRQSQDGDRDGIPVVLIEAMACGVPVISGDLPAIRELISDGECGQLVDGSKASQLVEALAEFANNPSLRARLGEAGRRRVEEEFSLSKNIDRLEEALRLAIHARDPVVAAPLAAQPLAPSRPQNLVRPGN